MPDKHKYAAITPRLPRELKDRAQEAVARMDTDLNALISTFLRWYVGDIDALPARPIRADRLETEETIKMMIACKLCRVESQKYPSRLGGYSSPEAFYMHRLEEFGHAYGRNTDSGNDIRRDVCDIYGVNTGSKLQEHDLPWGWLDAETGVRLCTNEEPESHRSCSRERFHAGPHKDATGHTWLQRYHFLLSRVEAEKSLTDLDLYETQQAAQVAASYDLGRKELQWNPQEQTFKYEARLAGRLTHIVTYIDISNVAAWLANA